MDKVFLSVKNMAAKLQVSEKTIYRMINDNRIPYSIKIGGQWRFNAEKIEKWIQRGATSENTLTNCIDNLFTLSTTIKEQFIMYKVHGNNRDEVLDEILIILNQFNTEEINIIKTSIMYKESIISSTINGISLMVVDHDEHININSTICVIAYLDTPIDFKAIDRMNSQIVILIIPANKTEQLLLTTRLRGLLMNPEFISNFKDMPNRKKLITLFKLHEDQTYCKSGKLS